MTLRIESNLDDEDVSTVRLIGRLEAENLPELATLVNDETRTVVLDMSEIDLVDLAAIQFLARCEASGVGLRNCSMYIKSWIAQEQKSHSF